MSTLWYVIKLFAVPIVSAWGFQRVQALDWIGMILAIVVVTLLLYDLSEEEYGDKQGSVGWYSEMDERQTYGEMSEMTPAEWDRIVKWIKREKERLDE